MVFSEQDAGGPDPPTKPTPAPDEGRGRPQLKVVK